MRFSVECELPKLFIRRQQLLTDVPSGRSEEGGRLLDAVLKKLQQLDLAIKVRMHASRHLSYRCFNIATTGLCHTQPPPPSLLAPSDSTGRPGRAQGVRGAQVRSGSRAATGPGVGLWDPQRLRDAAQVMRLHWQGDRASLEERRGVRQRIQVPGLAGIDSCHDEQQKSTQE